MNGNADAANNGSDGSANKRYDRQVRIWGAHGQTLLQAARVCMLGAGPVATETLKNLVLGGIASFTVVDSAIVSQSDLGNNFFFDQTSLNQGRAESAARLLRELNDSVQGAYSDLSVQDLLQSSSNFFADFSLVIAAEVRVCQMHAAACLAAARRTANWLRRFLVSSRACRSHVTSAKLSL